PWPVAPSGCGWLSHLRGKGCRGASAETQSPTGHGQGRRWSPGLARLAPRLVMPSAATSDRGVPSRAVTWRSIRYAWLTCGNGKSEGASRTWMVRVVTRPWPRSVAACANRDVLPGQGVENVEQAGLVVPGREREVRAPAMHLVRRGALRVEGIGRYDGPVQAQAIDQRDDHRDLVRLRADLGLGCDDAPASLARCISQAPPPRLKQRYQRR